ncbi:tripartite tricarboxylate transporter substrate binding protein [Roseovarius pacificus]|uniref:Bug family tripartite tricarboxylate transporter substrate binding protein n=1 Tax=Roseovarius pacificus TaxID=337701 RepID=UPI002A18D8FB|nr:tripartite tricarboxylate transporter substrate binding protein [Roseovarius pacificus]
MKNLRKLIGITALTSAIAFGGYAAAEDAADFPSKPIRMIVPFSPGGGTDTLSRIIADHMAQNWGQPVLVENKPGSAGLIGAKLTAEAEPDGYTIVNIISTHAIQDVLHSDAGFDPVEDFEPVILFASVPLALVVHPSNPVQTAEEFVTYAKENPDEAAYGMTGVGTAVHVAGEQFKQLAGIDMLAVPYKGGGPAKQDILGNHIFSVMTGLTTVSQEVQDGQLRALFVTTAERSPVLPDVPTAIEAGYPGFVRQEWWGVLAPAGTPKPIVDKLNAEITRIFGLPEVRERIENMGFTYLGGTPEEFGEFMAEEAKNGREVLKNAGFETQ